MTKLLIFLTLILSSLTSFAKVSDYYPDVYRHDLEKNNISSDRLSRVLFAILTKYHNPTDDGADKLSDRCETDGCYRHKVLSYSEARTYLFGKIHLKSDHNGHFVEDVYCLKKFRRNHGVGPMRIPNSNIINCEHTWPQSKFTSSFPRDMQKSDLNHLYPTDSKANSIRGNYPFASVYGGPIASNCQESYIGDAADVFKRGNYFEPPQNHKGNVARAIFYFSVRYRMPISSTQEAHLRVWHEQDPVDSEEMRRNNIIQEVQGNRNPFIDFPQLVQSIEDF